MKNLWILNHLMTGSYYLVILLRRFIDIHEYYLAHRNNKFFDSIYSELPIDNLINNVYKGKYKSHIRKNILDKKIFPTNNSVAWHSFINAGLIVDDLQIIEKEIPNLQYIHLTRNVYDRVANIYMLTIKKQNPIAIKNAGLLQEYISKPYDEDLNLLDQLYKYHSREQNIWYNKFLKNKEEDYITVKFEELWNDPTMQLIKILDFIECPFTINEVTKAVETIPRPLYKDKLAEELAVQ